MIASLLLFRADITSTKKVVERKRRKISNSGSLIPLCSIDSHHVKNCFHVMIHAFCYGASGKKKSDSTPRKLHVESFSSHAHRHIIVINVFLVAKKNEKTNNNNIMMIEIIFLMTHPITH